MSKQHDRREFLGRLGVGAAGLMAAGYTGTARGYAANETLNVGCIGTGGRTQMLMRSLEGIQGVRLTAVCDIWDQHLEAGKQLADPKAATTKDFRELLGRKDVDAVIIGSPDHWHVPMTVEACAAGKDVYVEKPLTHDLSEGAAVIEAQNQHQRIVQVGTQQRSMPQFQKAYEIITSGRLGPVYKVHLSWNRNAPRWTRSDYGVKLSPAEWKQFLGSAKDQPFDGYKFRQWRWFWDFGGGMLTDLMVHYIDVVHWIMKVDHPQLATTIGDNFATAGLWETPDTVQTLMQYPDRKFQAHFESTFVNAHEANRLEFMCADGTLYLDRGRYEIHPEPKRKVKAEEYVLGEGPRGKDFYDNPHGERLHLSNWIECIRSRKKPNCPAEAGVSAASAAHLANRALRSGNVARWKDVSVAKA